MGEVAIMAMRELQEKLVQAQAEIARLQNENKKQGVTMASELASKDQAMSKLQLETDQLQGAAQEMREALEATLSENDELAADLLSANSKVKGLEGQLSNTKEELNLCRQSLTMSRSKCNQAVHELSVVNEGLRKAGDAVDRERQAVTKLSREVESCQARNMALEAELRQLKDDLVVHECDIAGWKQKYELTASRALSAEARAERLATCEGRVTELHRALISERKARGEAESAAVRAKTAFTGLQGEIEDLKHQVGCHCSELQAIKPLAQSGAPAILDSGHVHAALSLALRNSEATQQHVMHLNQTVMKMSAKLDEASLKEIHPAPCDQDGSVARMAGRIWDELGENGVVGSLEPTGSRNSASTKSSGRAVHCTAQSTTCESSSCRSQQKGGNLRDCQQGSQVSSLPEHSDATVVSNSLNSRRGDAGPAPRAVAASKQGGRMSTSNPESWGILSKRGGKPAKNEHIHALVSNKFTKRTSAVDKTGKKNQGHKREKCWK